MVLLLNSIEKVRNNEVKALLLIDKNRVENAEKLLLRNLRTGTDSVLTYDLLIRIYNQKKDYSSLVKTLNSGIRTTGKKVFYRKLKKTVILSKLFQDIEDLSS
ncbi:MAG: hypothetical protein FJW69_05075 [Actinobacteria bacterium]|nr:hypothetical protein [Actinomycetota bacterium]MBM3713031.1 hypothetical protein [Actinomycetota bacterium]